MSWLDDYTNHDEAYWVARVQRLVAENTVPREDGHGDTDLKWVHNLIDELENNLPIGGAPYDGNMRMAAMTSMILALWFTQVANAKQHDPNRPTNDRQQASKKLRYYILDMIDNITDYHEHETHFPGQKWSDPWDAADRGGGFI